MGKTHFPGSFPMLRKPNSTEPGLTSVFGEAPFGTVPPGENAPEIQI